MKGKTMSITEAKTRLNVIFTILDELNADKRFKMAIDLALEALTKEETNGKEDSRD